MLKLLAFIPEPYASLLLLGLIGGAWLYGDITGKGSERQKNEIERLTNTVKVITEQRDTGLAIQTKMAETMSGLRLEANSRKERVSVVVKEIRTAAPARACLLSDAQRMRLRSIRIGSPSANP